MLAIGIAGLGVGWLVGLSQSPVIAAVLAALVAAAGTLVGPVAGRSSETGSLSAVPLAALIVGIAAGASAGLYARSNAWLTTGSDETSLSAEKAEQLVGRWVRLGLRREDVVQRLFERELPMAAAAPAAAPPPAEPRIPAGLVGEDAGTDECAGLRTVAPDQLWLELRASRRASVRNLAAALSGSTPPSVARLVLEVACPSEP